MTRTLIGIDYTGTPCVKITKGTADPVTTPDSQRGNFYFSSKWESQVTVGEIETMVMYLGSDDVGDQIFTPPGSNQATFSKYSIGGTAGTQYYYRNSYFPNLKYPVPLFTCKLKSGVQYIASRMINEPRGDAGPLGAVGGIYYCRPPPGFWGYNIAEYSYAPINIAAGAAFQLLATDANPSTAYVVIYDLPGDTQAVTVVPQYPTVGLQVVELSSTQSRVSKPGYDVRTATPDQLAFDANSRPAKIIKADDIYLPNGGTYVELGVAVPAQTVCEMHPYDGGQIYYPVQPRKSEFQITYYFTGTGLVLINNAVDCRLRYMVIAEDKGSPTSGANRVLTQFNDGIQDVVQILRPGSSFSPSFSDIVIDSRWPSLQILAEGSISIGAGVNQYNVWFDETGFFTFIKYMVLRGNSGGGVSVYEPKVSTLRNVNGLGGNAQAGDSTYATLNPGIATFYTAVGAPTNLWTDGGVTKTTTDTYPIHTIRYYIFGIAQ